MAAADSVSTIKPGTRVRFTDGPLGILHPHALAFIEATVGEGDEGTYRDVDEASGEDWHLITVDVDGEPHECPVHRSQFEVVD